MEVSRGRKPFTILAVLALAGIALALQLTNHYYQLRSGMAGFHSFCDISAKMNCDAVAASPYAEIAAGFPLSSFAAGWYVALLLLALLGQNRFWRREIARFALLMTGFGLLLSMVYLSIMAVKIKAFCLFCLGLDTISLLSLLTVLAMKPEGFSIHKPDFSKWTKMASVVVGSLLVLVLALKVTLDNVSISNSQIDSRISAILASPVLPVDTTGAPSFGPKNAPITIVEFSDFQCPYCRIGAMVMNALMERYPTQIHLIFMPFPLDASCNRIITHPMHLTACEAARTALCGNRQGKFSPIYKTFFEHQTEIVPGTPAKLAESVGADGAQLASCVKDPEISQMISRSIEQGIQLGVDSTPTFFVNGHKVLGLYPGPFWTRLVDKMLSAAK